MNHLSTFNAPGKPGRAVVRGDERFEGAMAGVMLNSRRSTVKI